MPFPAINRGLYRSARHDWPSWSRSSPIVRVPGRGRAPPRTKPLGIPWRASLPVLSQRLRGAGAAAAPLSSPTTGRAHGADATARATTGSRCRSTNPRTGSTSKCVRVCDSCSEKSHAVSIRSLSIATKACAQTRGPKTTARCDDTIGAASNCLVPENGPRRGRHKQHIHFPVFMTLPSSYSRPAAA